MSGAYNIPMAFGQGPDMVAGISEGLGNAAKLIQLQQAQQEIKRQNALRGILGAPGALDGTGQPKPETLSSVMGVDPAAGMKLQQNMLVTSQKQLQIDALRTKSAYDRADYLNNSYAPIMEQYKSDIAAGMPEPQARLAAQEATTKTTEDMSQGGTLPPDAVRQLPSKFDPVEFQRRAMQTQQYMTWWKQQQQDKRADAKEKEQDKRADQATERAGSSVGQLADGTAVIFKPNAPAGRRVQYAQSGDPVPEELLKGARKTGTAAPSASSADREAQQSIVKDNLEKELGRQLTAADKPELDRRVLAAEDARKAAQAGDTTAAREKAKQATAKPVPVTINGVRQDALWRDGKYLNLDGTPIEGKVLGVSRTSGKTTPGQAAEDDAMAIADQRIQAKETELGRPLDQAERAELRQAARVDPKIQEAARKQDATAISDDAAKLVAEESLHGDWHGTVGMGRNAASMRKVADWRAKLAKEQGLSGADLAANTAEFNGILAAERVLGTRGAGIDLGIAEAQKFAPMVLELSDKVKRTQFPTINALQQAVQRGTGGEDVVRLTDALNAYKMAYTQILTRGGMPTDDARRRSDEVINQAWSNGQIHAAIDQLNKEMIGARSAIPEVRDNLYRTLTGKNRPGTTLPTTGQEGQAGPRATPAAPAAPSVWQQGQPIPEKAIEMLKASPKTAEQFEHTFGPGSAQQYLKPPAPTAAPAPPPPPATAPVTQPAARTAPKVDDLPDGAIVKQGGKRYRKKGNDWIEVD